MQKDKSGQQILCWVRLSHIHLQNNFNPEMLFTNISYNVCYFIAVKYSQIYVNCVSICANMNV